MEPTEAETITLTVTCPLCKEVMIRPKFLPCLHNICRKCLQTHISTHGLVVLRSKKELTNFPCPVCEEEVKPPSPLESGDKWVDQFPSNFFLNVMCLIMSVQKRYKSCDPCNQRGVTGRADWWCRDCIQFQCDICRCQTIHNDYKHCVFETKQLKHHIADALPKLQPCIKHKHNITMFCRVHAQPCCETCISGRHKKCTRVVSVREEYGLFEKNGHIQQLLKYLTHYLDALSDIMTNRSEIEQDLPRKRDRILSQIKKTGQDLKFLINELERKLLDEFSELDAYQELLFSELEETSKRLTAQITNSIQLLEAVNKHGAQQQIMSFSDMIAYRCIHYGKILGEMQSQELTTDYRLQINGDMESVLEDGATLGKIVAKTSKGNAYSVSLNPYKKGKARNICRLRVSLTGDKSRCGIVGGVIFYDGRILLADFDNCKMKLFSDKGRLLSRLPLQFKPCDVSMVNQETSVVSFRSTKYLQLIQIFENTLKLGSTIALPGVYHGVSCVEDKLYLISNHGVSACDLDGKNFQGIDLEDDKNSPLVLPGNIKATTSGIYITDYKTSNVFAYSCSGQLLFTYLNEKLRCPHGLDVDGRENVYICGKNSSNVHQISRKGKHMQILLADKDVEDPLTIVFQKGQDKFFITESKTESRDFIRLFILE